MSEMNPYSKLQIHVRDIARVRSLRFAFYRFLYIINRRIKVPNVVFLADSFDLDEFALQKFLNPLKNLVVVDVGAKVGLWSKKFAIRGTKVHAFEPNPEAFAFLKRNTRKFDNVIAYPCALGNENGINDFFVHKRPGYSSFVTKYADHIKTIRVPVRTLDSFNFETVDLIKIDTEGYELPVLRGGRETIRRERPQLYIEIHNQGQKNLIFKLLQEFGYTYSIHHLRNRPQPIIITDLED